MNELKGVFFWSKIQSNDTSFLWWDTLPCISMYLYTPACNWQEQYGNPHRIYDISPMPAVRYSQNIILLPREDGISLTKLTVSGHRPDTRAISGQYDRRCLGPNVHEHLYLNSDLVHDLTVARQQHPRWRRPWRFGYLYFLCWFFCFHSIRTCLSAYMKPYHL